MFISSVSRLESIVFVSSAIIYIISLTGSCNTVHGYPTASASLFTHVTKLDNKLTPNLDTAERSFQEFINSKPESTIIGQFKPNATEFEIMLLRNKIASAILSMQESEKTTNAKSPEMNNGSDCFIEVTKVERVGGKCQKVRNGIAICQADNYMAINTDCS